MPSWFVINSVYNGEFLFERNHRFPLPPLPRCTVTDNWKKGMRLWPFLWPVKFLELPYFQCLWLCQAACLAVKVKYAMSWPSVLPGCEKCLALMSPYGTCLCLNCCPHDKNLSLLPFCKNIFEPESLKQLGWAYPWVKTFTISDSYVTDFKWQIWSPLVLKTGLIY